MTPFIAPEGLIFLSMPYSHPLEEVRSQRMETFWRVAGELAVRGVHVVSPMSLEPALAQMEARNIPLNWTHWAVYCRTLLQSCQQMWVIDMDGWDASEGVAGEIAHARKHAILVQLIDPDTLELKRMSLASKPGATR